MTTLHWFCRKYYNSLNREDHFDVWYDGFMTSCSLPKVQEKSADCEKKLTIDWCKWVTGTISSLAWWIIATQWCHFTPKMIRTEAKLKGLEGKAVKVKQGHPTLSILESLIEDQWNFLTNYEMMQVKWIHILFNSNTNICLGPITDYNKSNTLLKQTSEIKCKNQPNIRFSTAPATCLHKVQPWKTESRSHFVDCWFLHFPHIT